MSSKQLVPYTGRRSAGKKGKKAKSNNQPKRAPLTKAVQLSQCAADYARCLANAKDGPLACVPTFPAFKSLKSRVWARGVIQIAEDANLGFAVMSPFRMSQNDGSALIFSTGTYASNDITTTTGTTVLAANSNSPFATADITTGEAGVAIRVVSAELRVRYIGTELNKGGRIVALHDPTHSTLNGRSESEGLNELQTKTLPCSRDWTIVPYKPVSAGDVTFAAANPAASVDYYMGMWIDHPGVAVTYEVEAYAVLEMQGVNVRGQTDSHSDPSGFASVSSVSSKHLALNPNQIPAPAREKSVVQSVIEYVQHGLTSATHVMQSAASLAHTAQTAYTVGSELYGVAQPMLSLLG